MAKPSPLLCLFLIQRCRHPSPPIPPPAPPLLGAAPPVKSESTLVARTGVLPEDEEFVVVETLFTTVPCSR